LEAVQRQIATAYEKHYLSEVEMDSLTANDFVTFAVSSIGKRMAKAQEEKLLKREQPFVLGLSAQDVDKDWPAEETVLIQGIIDAYFYENDEIVLVDYKTDKVGYKNGAAQLVERYKVQLDYYAQALERLTGKRVKEKIIYSFTLNREISVV
jgi:ATP-dependent helicase/nuclease subunit A